MGVTVHLNAPVKEVGEGYVVAGDQRFESAVIIWAAGVEGSPVTRTLAGAPLDRGGRVQVSPDLSLPGRPEVFAVGDLAAITDAKGVRVPWLAPAATQMGRHAAEQILEDLGHRERVVFVYRDKGSMATIGRSKAVAQVFGMNWTGLPAWLLWMSVHLMFLMGMRNRIGVFLSWVWSYCRWQRGARIIVDPRPPVAGELAKR
jgi:NADH:ubiquinone reductase (H+-translocating)